MAVADQNGRPAIVIEVEESATPAQKLRVRAQACCEGRLLEVAATEVAVERGRVAGEVRLDQVEIAIEIVVGGGDAHTSLGLAIRTERTTCLDRDVFKRSVLFIVVERARGRVIGDVNVGPAVVVEIGNKNAQAVGAVGAEYSSSFGDVSESSVAIVVVKNILAALKSSRTAGDHHSFVEAWAGFGHWRRGQIHIDVVSDEEIQPSVAVVIYESAASVPARAFSRHSRFLADIGKRSVAIIVVKNILAVVSNTQIVPAVVVIVADANASCPA